VQNMIVMKTTVFMAAGDEFLVNIEYGFSGKQGPFDERDGLFR
jgi:hypothetical protein